VVGVLIRQFLAIRQLLVVLGIVLLVLASLLVFLDKAAGFLLIQLPHSPSINFIFGLLKLILIGFFRLDLATSGISKKVIFS
jgi:hypothetical protein